ncbi:MAG TPA: hypothetical protein VE621_17995 [Bryobacteraceae bacterium]|jgi:CYTH domain-containing protein|nr:hypothetical protein [Bryobacteraceae bacterium]
MELQSRGATWEVEEYAFNGEGITVVAVEIVPDIANPSVIATIEEFRLA